MGCPFFAIATALQEAELCKREGHSETILIHLCGHGHYRVRDNFLTHT